MTPHSGGKGGGIREEGREERRERGEERERREREKRKGGVCWAVME
jgi:hypothetical protein